jgi:Recombination endonuclease VII
MCKLCYNQQRLHWRNNVADKDRLRKQWREAAKKYQTPEIRRKRVLAQYGLTLESYDEMLTAQNGACKICEKSPKEGERLLHVDHCHATGAIRGLLCDRCNVGLGCFGDSHQHLLKAAAYLEEFASK